MVAGIGCDLCGVIRPDQFIYGQAGMVRYGDQRGRLDEFATAAGERVNRSRAAPCIFASLLAEVSDNRSHSDRAVGGQLLVSTLLADSLIASDKARRPFTLCSEEDSLKS